MNIDHITPFIEVMTGDVLSGIGNGKLKSHAGGSLIWQEAQTLVGNIPQVRHLTEPAFLRLLHVWVFTLLLKNQHFGLHIFLLVQRLEQTFASDGRSPLLFVCAEKKDFHKTVFKSSSYLAKR